MKKSIAVFLFLCYILMSFSSCSNRPKDMSKDAYNLGLRAVNVMDKYAAAEISGEEAISSIDNLSSSLDSLYESTNESYCLSLSIELDAYTLAIKSGGDAYSHEQDVKELLGVVKPGLSKRELKRINNLFIENIPEEYKDSIYFRSLIDSNWNSVLHISVLLDQHRDSLDSALVLVKEIYASAKNLADTYANGIDLFIAHIVNDDKFIAFFTTYDGINYSVDTDDGKFETEVYN